MKKVFLNQIFQVCNFQHGIDNRSGLTQSQRRKMLILIVISILSIAACTRDTETPVGTGSGPPLILVHGFKGFDLKNKEGHSCNEFIVEYDERNSTLGELAEWFEKKGYSVWIAHYSTSWNGGTPRLEENAECLREQFEHVYRESDNHEVTIVAHSMGGVVSRIAIHLIDDPDKISEIFTLGSPHAGVPDLGLSRLAPNCRGHPGVCQLVNWRMPTLNEEYGNLRGVDYYFIGGDKGPSLARWFWRRMGAGENDSVIGQYSSVGWVYPSSEFDPDAWPGKSFEGQYWTQETHSEDKKHPYYYGPRKDGNNSFSFQCIFDLLQGRTPDESDCSPPKDFDQVITEPFQMTEVQTGILIHDSQTFSISIDADFMLTEFHDPDANLIFFVITDQDEFSFSVTTPNEIQIDGPLPETFNGVTYESSLASEESPPMAAYSFNANFMADIGIELEGEWDLEIIGEQGMRYQAFALLESNLTLRLLTEQRTFKVGQDAIFTVELANNGIGIENAFVTANCTDINFDHMGRGIYEGTCKMPAVPYFLNISIVAKSPFEEYSRQVDLIVEIINE